MKICGWQTEQKRLYCSSPFVINKESWNLYKPTKSNSKFYFFTDFACLIRTKTLHRSITKKKQKSNENDNLKTNYFLLRYIHSRIIQLLHLHITRKTFQCISHAHIWSSYSKSLAKRSSRLMETVYYRILTDRVAACLADYWRHDNLMLIIPGN